MGISQVLNGDQPRKAAKFSHDVYVCYVQILDYF